MPGQRCAENDWVALLVRVNHEKVAASQLGKHGYEFFLPTYTPPKSSGVKAKLPLFPGYLFCRYQRSNPYRIVRAPGVIRLLGGEAGPEAVPEQELDAIRRVTDSGVTSKPWDYLRAGQRVRIVDGPLTGLEGSLVMSKSQLRFIVSVGLLQRSVAVEVSAEQLEVVTD